MKIRNGQKLFVVAKASMETPPMSWLTARNRSAAKLRSANCVLKNIATIAAMLKPASTKNCWLPSKPIAGKYPNTSGSHGPQMNNSRNIMMERRVRMKDMLGLGKDTAGCGASKLGRILAAWHGEGERGRGAKGRKARRVTR